MSDTWDQLSVTEAGVNFGGSKLDQQQAWETSGQNTEPPNGSSLVLRHTAQVGVAEPWISDSNVGRITNYP
jgi:hypothetical protein